MSKQAGEEPKGLSQDLLEKEREIIRLKADLEETRASNKKLSTQNSKLRAKGADSEGKPEEKLSSLTSTPAPKEPESEHIHEKEPDGGLPPAPSVKETKKEEGLHLVKSWSPRFCPDCGTKNPEFKDEVQCHNCKVGLGAKEKVTSSEFKVCPNCGRGKDNGGGWEYVPGVKVV